MSLVCSRKYVMVFNMNFISFQTCLGILNENENDSSDIIDIMEFIEGFVSTGSSKVEPILSFGDLLTVERQINAQEDRRNSTSSKGRMEDVIPCLSDFHFLGNFFEVRYHIAHFKDNL